MSLSGVSAEEPDSPSDNPEVHKRKVGRPISYTERKTIKRRIANRESARRARQRKLCLDENLQRMLRETVDKAEAMVKHAQAGYCKSQAMCAEMQRMRGRLTALEDSFLLMEAELKTAEQQLSQAEVKAAEPLQTPKAFRELIGREEAMQQHVVSLEKNSHAMLAEIQRMLSALCIVQEECCGMEQQLQKPHSPLALA